MHKIKKFNINLNHLQRKQIIKVLMMQEAKSSCAGQWYLPAGKMEPGEDIVEAAVREVKEETGLEFEVTSLLLGEFLCFSTMEFLVSVFFDLLVFI